MTYGQAYLQRSSNSKPLGTKHSFSFQELPHEYVPPNMLKKVAMHGDTNKLYATEIRRSDQFERKMGGGYDADEFEAHPERYISTFSHKYAPYASVIVNGIYWSPQVKSS